VRSPIIAACAAAALLIPSACIDDLGGHPAAGIEIIVEKDFNGRRLAPGDAVYLHELPTGGGFYEAKYSRLYRGPLPAAAGGQEEYGAGELVGPNVLGVLAREHVDAITGIIFGEVQIPNSGRLYENLWWMLFAGADYPAVLFSPVPGQPTPPSGMPITTHLLVCNTDEPDARTCRSWPGAVSAGMVVCRDQITKSPVSKSKCTILAPYTQWWVRGSPPPPVPVAPTNGCGYPLAMAKTRAQELIDSITEREREEGRRARENMSDEEREAADQERREAEAWAANLRAAADPNAEPDHRWDYVDLGEDPRGP
jgi:hypothetical protein